MPPGTGQMLTWLALLPPMVFGVLVVTAVAAGMLSVFALTVAASAQRRRA